MLIEQKLIKRIKKKQDKEAANALISYYYKEVYAYVYRQTGNEELAKDLTLKQEQIDMTDENLELHSGNLGTAVRDLSELIIHKELIEDIMEIVSLYKQEWQEIFYMKCFEERTFQDISQTLNISENTVKSRFYKMIRQIKSEVNYQ